MSIQDILKEVKQDIRPSKEEEKELKAKIDKVLKKINSKIKGAKAILGGSGAKGTWLKDTYDADLFVLFDYKKYKEKTDQLSDILEKTLKKIFPKISRLHGSRDYFQIKKDGFIYEIVPILNIKKAEKAMNITDVSPLHAAWVKKHKNLADEIRLTKKFCKASKVYGAESYIGGFSGYICEILTIYYGNFLNLIKKAARWKEKEIIDIERYHKNKNILDRLNRSKLNSPLIIIDPVQKDRNAAAALRKEKFEKFKKRCKGFLKKPSKDFFIRKQITIEDLKKQARDNYLLLLEITPKKGKRDVIGSKMIKAFDHIKKSLNSHDFSILKSGWEWNKKAVFYLIIKKQKLSLKKIREGPPIHARPHAQKFKKKYKKTFEKNKKLFAEIKREFMTPDELLEEVINHDYVKERVKDIQILVF